MSLPRPRFTYEDYKLLPEERRYEGTFAEAGGMGQVVPTPTDVIRCEETVVQPDLLSTIGRDIREVIPAGFMWF